MPFCVSSFAALVKDVGYVLIFPPSLRENAIGGGFIALFLLALAILRASYTKPGKCLNSPWLYSILGLHVVT